MFTYRKSYYILRPWKLINEIYYDIKWFVQRGWRGYADCDLWSIDDYLCRWMPEALRKLAQTVHGVPGDMAPYPNSSDEDFKRAQASWKSQIMLMADAFEQHKKLCDFEHKFGTPEWKAAEETIDKGMKLFIERFGNLWD